MIKNSPLKIADPLWDMFNKKYGKIARAHRLKFVADDEFNCNVVSVVKRGEGLLPIGTVVTVTEVYPPQQSNEFTWRRMRRPYIPCKVVAEDHTQMCNLESLEPV